MRVILVLSAMIIGSDGHLVPMPCGKIAFLGTAEKALKSYPECGSYFNGQDPTKVALVTATMSGDASNSAAALSLGFGPALWLAMILHAAGVEIYVRGRTHQNRIGNLRELTSEAPSYTRRSRSVTEGVVPTTARGRHETPRPRRSHC